MILVRNAYGVPARVRWFCWTLLGSIALAVSWVIAAHAVEPARDKPLIGEVWLATPLVARPYVEAFRGGLRDVGLVDGKTMVTAARFAGGDPSRLPGLVAELVALEVDVLFVTSKALPAAMQATKTIPIVAIGFSDPVAEGIAASLAKPGGNVTGVSSQSADTAGKRLELARDLVPSSRRVALLFDPAEPVDARTVRALAESVGLKTESFELSEPSKLNTVLSRIQEYRPDVLYVGVSPVTLVVRNQICAFATTRRIALISEGRVMAEAGALATYGPNDFEIVRHAATYVAKILQGAKPSSLPIEQPTKHQLIVNLRTANAIGLSVPSSFLQRADEVIR